MQWITDWSKIIMGENYIVCPIGLLAEGHTRLAQPIGRLAGWEVVRLLAGTYAALLVPAWDGHFKIPGG